MYPKFLSEERVFEEALESLAREQELGAFTTCLLGELGVFRLEEHIERLLRDASYLGLAELEANESSVRQLKEDISDFLAEKDHEAPLRLRFLWSKKGIHIFLSSEKPLWESSDGVKAITVIDERTRPTHKTTDVLINREARRKATLQGVDEALFVTPDGILREGAWSNIFWVDREGLLYTTETKILPGITRGAILDLTECVLKDISLSAFMERATEAFLTQSTTGVTPLISVNGEAIGSGKIGPVTKQLQADYKAKACRLNKN